MPALGKQDKPLLNTEYVMFGVKLKEKMDELGIEADLNYPGARTTYSSHIHFFKVKFGKE